MHYLKYFVIGSSGLVILVSIMQTLKMIMLHRTYLVGGCYKFNPVDPQRLNAPGSNP
jgi:hypothetical protein